MCKVFLFVFVSNWQNKSFQHSSWLELKWIPFCIFFLVFIGKISLYAFRLDTWIILAFFEFNAGKYLRCLKIVPVQKQYQFIVSIKHCYFVIFRHMHSFRIKTVFNRFYIEKTIILNECFFLVKTKNFDQVLCKLFRTLFDLFNIYWIEITFPLFHGFVCIFFLWTEYHCEVNARFIVYATK